MKRLALIQPSYLPWRGYFDIVGSVDIFVFYDDAEYSKNTWRNRNKIKTANGPVWLTVPVKYKGFSKAKINEIEIDNSKNWMKKHLETIKQSYKKSKYYNDYVDILTEIYDRNYRYLSDLDIYSTKKISQCLGIDVEWKLSSSFPSEFKKTDRIIDICKKNNANHYLSGPSASDYIEKEKFRENEISFDYKEYSYSEYSQLHGEFEPFVSALDLLFNCGPNSRDYIWNRQNLEKK